MAIPISHYLGSLIERLAGIDDAGEFLEKLGIDQSINLLVGESSVKVTPEATILNLDLSTVFHQIIVAEFPQSIGTLAIRIGDDQGKTSLSIATDWRSIEFDSVQVIYSARPDLLRPLEPDNDVLEVSFGARITLFSDFGFEIVPDLKLDLGPAYLGPTDIIIQLQGLKPEFSFKGSPAALKGNVSVVDFRGVYIHSGYIRVLNEYLFGDEYGIQADFKHFSFRASGISGTIHSYWSGGLSTNLFGVNQSIWELNLKSLQVDIKNSFPQTFRMDAEVKIPLLPVRLEGFLSLGFGETGKYQLSVNTVDPLLLDFGFGTMRFDTITATGAFSPAELDLSGSCQNFSLVSDPLSLSVASTSLSIHHSDQLDKLSVAVDQVDLGSFSISSAAVVIEIVSQDDQQGHKVYVEGSIAWQDLTSRISLPENIPLPPDDATISLKAHWELQPDSSYHFKFYLHFIAEDAHSLWSFIPEAFRPEVPFVELAFGVTAASDSAIQVDVEGRIDIVLPELPDGLISDQINLSAGNEQGVVACDFAISSEGKISLSTNDLLNLEISLPGGLAETPFIETRLTKFAFDTGISNTPAGSVSGAQPGNSITRMAFEGDFAFKPLVPGFIPFASHLNQLLAQVGLNDIRGKADLLLSFSDQAFDLNLTGAFDAFGIEIDVFHLLSNLSSGGETPSSQDIDIDFDIGFRLIGFSFNIGNLHQSGTTGSGDFYFSFSLNIECNMTGLPPLQAQIKLSNSEFSFGLENLTIPLEIPNYPISVADLERLKGSGQSWTVDARDTVVIDLDHQIAEFDDLLADQELSERDRFRVSKDKSFLELKKLLLQLVMEIHGRVGNAGHGTYQAMVVADTWFHETLLNFFHVETELKLNFPEIKLRIPFDDPSGIGISGSGKVIGFAPDDPMQALENYVFSLGLSSEYIFAKIEANGDPIGIPSFGTPYDDGSIAIDKFLIGYGYSKNSFALDFAGQLVIPSKLREDADTSSGLGIGVRLPRYNKLAFKIDLIPVTIVKVTIVIPVPRFDLDLRTPDAPALVSTSQCEPYWDGFELIAPDVVHLAFKRLAFSPFFGFSITPNLKLDGDLQIGNDQQGATLIVDDALVLFGTFVGTYFLPIPFFADPTQPYFKNICANLRVAGFEVNFNMQRPFPNTSPMAALEAFGLISNPQMPIDPGGALANTIRFTLSDAYLKVPDYALAMFPDAANLVNKTHGFTLNLGTLISFTQSVVGLLKPVIEQITDSANQGVTDFNSILNSLPNSFDPWDWIKLLPPELRKFRTGGQIAGFEASACLVIATTEEARKGLREKNSVSRQLGQPAVEAVTLETEQAVIRRLKSTPLYKPTFGLQFDTVWIGHGADNGEWEKSEGGVQNISVANVENFLVYQKSGIPGDFHISITVDTRPINAMGYAGILFCYVNEENYYRLMVGKSLSGEVEISLQKVMAGQLSHLLAYQLSTVQTGTQTELKLTTFEISGRRCFEISSARFYHGGAERIEQKLPKVFDDSDYLVSGMAGLYNRGIPDVLFTEMLVFGLTSTGVTPMQISPGSLQQGFTVNAGDTALEDARLITRDESSVLFKGLEFDKFGESHLDLLSLERLEHLQADDSGVYLGAYIKVFSGQRLRFLGQLFTDGSFALVSELESKPLKLTVLGISIAIPFSGYANLTLSGRQRRRGYQGFIAATGHLVWAPVPNIVTFSIGSENRPAHLKLFSGGQFQLDASAGVSLFNGAGKIIDGWIDISQDKARFGGSLGFRLGQTIPDYPFPSILDLEISGEGEIMSLDQYRFKGRGDIKFLGDSFSDIEVSVTERYAKFDLHLKKSAGGLPNQLEKLFPILNSCDFDLKGNCQVSLRRTIRPEFVMSGEGQMEIFGARITGKGEIKALPSNSVNSRKDFFSARMDGNVFWQGRKWLGGEIFIGSQGFKIAGTTNFGLQLTPDHIPGIDVSLASLFLGIQLDGELRLDARKKSVFFIFKGSWTLGAVLADSGQPNPRQLLPLASNTFTFSSAHSAMSPEEFRINLINIEGFKYLPLDSLTIPVPNVTMTGNSETEIVRVGKTRYVSNPPVGNPETTYKSAVEFSTPLGTLGIEDIVPYYNQSKPWVQNSLTKLYSEYDIDLSFSEFTLDLGSFTSINLSLTLQNDADSGFPIRLRVATPLGEDYFP